LPTDVDGLLFWVGVPSGLMINHHRRYSFDSTCPFFLYGSGLFLLRRVCFLFPVFIQVKLWIFAGRVIQTLSILF